MPRYFTAQYEPNWTWFANQVSPIDENVAHKTTNKFKNINIGEIYVPTARYGHFRIKTSTAGGYDEIGSFRTFGNNDGPVVRILV